MIWLKEQSTKFYDAWIHALIQRWNIVNKRNGDNAGKKERDPQKTTFILMYDTCPVLVIIPLIKKRLLLFDSPYKIFYC